MRRWLEITTVMGCRNLCDYCPQFVLLNSYKGQPRMLSMDVFRKCIDRVPIDVEIHFSGYAEPWLNSNCTEMLLYAFARGHRIAVYTTLVGMKSGDVALIERIPFITFLVHLPDADGLMKVRVDDNYLERLLQIDSIGLSGLTYRTIGRQHPAITRLIGPQTEELLNGDFVHSRAGNVEASVVSRPNPLVGPIRCAKDRMTKNVLLPNGDVTLCCMDYGLRHVLGNLLENEYVTLHRSAEFRYVLSSLSTNNVEILCRRCEWAETA